MKNVLTNTETSSLNHYTNSLEELLPGSSVKVIADNHLFHSSAKGILIDGFYVGRNLTYGLREISIRNTQSIIFNIPLRGSYYTQCHKDHLLQCNKSAGVLYLPTAFIQYRSDETEIEDMIIIMNFNQFESLLSESFDFTNFPYDFIQFDTSSNKVNSIIKLIQSSIDLVGNFPHFQDSYSFKLNIKGIARLLLFELIRGPINIKLKIAKSRQSTLVREAERLIETDPSHYESIGKLAENLNTTARNIQKAFKKIRNYSPMQFQTRVRLTNAREKILKSNIDTQIKEIALAVGYNNMSNFSSSYKKLFSELPSETLARINQMDGEV